ncbi:MAG: tetratricopeptide repeat protein [Elainellaceae cyanobacterium]
MELNYRGNRYRQRSADKSSSGIEHYQEGRYQQALEDLSQALRYIPQASGLWAVRAECLAQLNRYDEAILSMDYAVHLDPSNQTLQRDRQLLVTVGGMHQIKM